MQVGDVVIVKDDNKARIRWSLARVMEKYPNKADGLVGSVKKRLETLISPALARECIPHQFWKDPFKSLSCCCQERKDRDSRIGSH